MKITKKITKIGAAITMQKVINLRAINHKKTCLMKKTNRYKAKIYVFYIIYQNLCLIYF